MRCSLFDSAASIAARLEFREEVSLHELRATVSGITRSPRAKLGIVAEIMPFFVNIVI